MEFTNERICNLNKCPGNFHFIIGIIVNKIYFVILNFDKEIYWLNRLESFFGMDFYDQSSFDESAI